VQRPFKLVVKCSQHADIVNEALALLQKKQDTPSAMWLNTTLPTLRDCSVQWLLNGYHPINKPEVIKQAFASCHASPLFNLSFDSLTS
ncbi:hypothetical protein BDR07DRAFT_1250643, partial [Suillus spraguei]